MDNIEVRDEKGQMFYAGEVPWHGLGTGVLEAVTAEEAITLAGLDWEVALQPIYSGRTHKEARVVQGRMAIARQLDSRVYGIVSPQYKPFQNREAFTFLDSLIQDGVMRYESAGALFDGRQVWILARLAEDMQINGEEFYSYVLLTMGHDGYSSIRVLPTEVRVICWNTLQLALGAREKNVRIRVIHSPSLQEKMAAAAQVLEVTTAAQRRMKEFLERAAEYKVGEEAVLQVQTALFGSLDEETSAQRKSAIETFAAIYAAESQLNGSNAYSLVNAVTGYADHSIRYNGTETEKAERRMAGMLYSWGTSSQFLTKGLTAVEEIVKVDS